MSDKELKLLGLSDRTITFDLDEDIQIAIEYDNYLKKLDEEKKKEDTINLYKKEYENFKEKKKHVDTLMILLFMERLKTS